MLAKLKELQQRQQQLNEQLAQDNARQSADRAGEQPSQSQKPSPGSQSALRQQGSQPGQQDQASDNQQGETGSKQTEGDRGDEGNQRERGSEEDDKRGADGEKKAGDSAENSEDGKTGTGEQESDSGGQEGDQDPSNQGSGDADEAAAEQIALGKASGEVADQLTEMPTGKSESEANDVAGELRRAATFQENAASAIVRRQLAEATRLGGEGSAAIAEAIHKLEELVFAGKQSGNEAESYPDGYEQLIQEYLRAISYE